MKDSKYQLAIYDEYDNTNNNICIEATAGSGKTTTILNLLKRTPPYKKVIFCAFNKSIQEELSSRVPDQVKVSTIHSLAYSILRYNIKANFKLTEYKNYQLALKLVKKKFKKDSLKQSYLFTISNIVDLYRMNLCKNKEELITILDQRTIDYSKGELEDALKLIKYLETYNKENHDTFLIDFTDMLWLVKELVPEHKFPRYDVVMVDEGQDLNLLQHHIISNIVKPSGRIIAVGDSQQSIYSFMGSSPEAFNKLKEKPKTTSLPLSVTYRCSKKIVEEAQKVFPDKIEYFEEASEGIVRKGSLNELKEGDFLLCRNNLPLMEAFIDLLTQGKKAHIMGKDFSKSLLRIIRKVESSGKEQANEVFKKMLNEKWEQLKEKGVHNISNNASYITLKENIEIVKILANAYGGYENLESKMDEIFTDDQEGITLSTIHKSKGLESERVFFYMPELLPSKYAKTDLELFAEKCLEFVAITRAKKELVYVKAITNRNEVKSKEKFEENIKDAVI
jgi:superfamily I DNA/RNA helicase